MKLFNFIVVHKKQNNDSLIKTNKTEKIRFGNKSLLFQVLNPGNLAL